MSRPVELAKVTLAALLAGCAEADLAVDEDGALASAWLEVGATQFEGDGESGRVTIAAQAPLAALALRITTAPGVCFQLSGAVDGAGRTVIDGRSAGSFCRDCELRTSVAVEAGVFVLPVESGRFAPDTGASLRFARVDCQTLTPLSTPDDRPPLRIDAQPVEVVPERATIDLRFHVADSSILFGDDDRQRELIALLEQELAASGVAPRLVESRELEEIPATLRFHAGDVSELAAAFAGAPPKDETTVDVVFGGCLLYDDPVFGPPRAVNGFTPRIPGGAGPADGVFMPGLDCFAEGAGPVDIPLGAQARVLAHELGHYLGLYHAVEADGLADPLDDTDADNIMNPRTELAGSLGFSPSQGRVMRTHPAVRAAEGPR
ncbi:hypothetical protein OV079_05680 [Nannocystis pusilla]|uniref:Peptidase M43 pregnancy-associated plasma-A domain-containing protein n=1 Tax=Nannocystis pusilla TaxID=889268 RepID=A0A9X3IWR9_9BACT|nr:hypothetical protein [Nannocystis pusilla]MCY1005068.1 hypothetical protein [Nannocystis pusilla]